MLSLSKELLKKLSELDSTMTLTLEGDLFKEVRDWTCSIAKALREADYRLVSTPEEFKIDIHPFINLSPISYTNPVVDRYDVVNLGHTTYQKDAGEHAKHKVCFSAEGIRSANFTELPKGFKCGYFKNAEFPQDIEHWTSTFTDDNTELPITYNRDTYTNGTTT